MRSRKPRVRLRNRGPRFLGAETLEARLNLAGDGVSPDPAPVETDFECDRSALRIRASPTSEAATAVNCLAIDFYEYFNAQDGNLLFSPLSISTALAMATEAANGQTAAEMKDVLFQTDGIDQSYDALIEAINKDGQVDAPIVDVANAIWPHIATVFHESYLDKIAESYGGYAQALDYENNADSYKVINEWVEEQTQGTIDEIFEKPLSPLTRMVLTNSIYFNGDWAVDFNATSTPFQLESGQTKSVEAISVFFDAFSDGVGNGPRIRYSFIDNHEVVSIPYGNGEASMVLVVPATTDYRIPYTSEFPVAEDLTVDDLTPETLAEVNRWLNSNTGSVEAINLKLPQFTMSVASNLNELLQGMGMPTAFKFGEADFSRMTDTPTYIADILHNAFIDVNEEGTEASAVTAVVFEGLCFAKGTPVRTASGTKLIEDIEVGDEVLSRSDGDLNGAIRPKRVEELFRGTRPVIDVHVEGQVIRSTDEHPFFVQGKGWVSARNLEAGDQLACDVASWKTVERIVDNGEVVDVYNFRVAAFHTYFVGSDAWGFSVWTHNCCCEPVEMTVDRPFHYFIRDNETSSILFMGRVMDPQQTENSLAPKVVDVRTPAESNVDVPQQPEVSEPATDANGRLLGDVDGNQAVDFADFLVVSQNFGQATELGDEAGDFNDDGVTDFADFLLVSVNFGKSLV